MYLTGIQWKRRQKNRFLPDSFEPCLNAQVGLASEFQATNGSDYIKIEHCNMPTMTLDSLSSFIGVSFRLESDVPDFSISLVELDSVVQEEGTNLFSLNLKIIE